MYLGRAPLVIYDIVIVLLHCSILYYIIYIMAYYVVLWYSIVYRRPAELP